MQVSDYYIYTEKRIQPLSIALVADLHGAPTDADGVDY